MAYSIVWPVTLPQTPQKGFTESGGASILRTPMDSGPAKMRRRGNLPSKLGVSFLMTSAQVAVLKSWIDNTIRGTIRFGFPHPRTGEVAEVRIIPTQEGELYTFTYAAPGYWTVNLNLEILP